MYMCASMNNETFETWYKMKERDVDSRTSRLIETNTQTTILEEICTCALRKNNLKR